MYRGGGVDEGAEGIAVVFRHTFGENTAVALGLYMTIYSGKSRMSKIRSASGELPAELERSEGVLAVDEDFLFFWRTRSLLIEKV
jgi:hypothetical protein